MAFFGRSGEACDLIICIRSYVLWLDRYLLCSPLSVPPYLLVLVLMRVNAFPSLYFVIVHSRANIKLIATYFSNKILLSSLIIDVCPSLSAADVVVNVFHLFAYCYYC